MKVYELMEKKMDEMNEADFEELAKAMGTQFGLVLHKFFGVMPLNADPEKTYRVFENLDVIETPAGDITFIYDTSPAGIERLRARLFGEAS